MTTYYGTVAIVLMIVGLLFVLRGVAAAQRGPAYLGSMLLLLAALCSVWGDDVERQHFHACIQSIENNPGLPVDPNCR